MRRRVPAAHAIVELRIGADFLVADDQTGGNIGIGGDELFDDRDDGIIGAGAAEDDLIGRIVELKA